MIGIVYIIWVLDQFYIGSTWDMDERKIGHNERLYTSNYKLYVAIRSNNNEFVMTIHHEFICDTDEELRQEEQRTMDVLLPTLNSHRAYCSEEYNKERNKERHAEWYELNKEKFNKKRKQDKIDNPDKYKEINEKNKEKLTCMCGIEYTRSHKNRHERSNFHINFCKINNIVDI